MQNKYTLLLINFTVNDQLGIKIERCSMTALVVNVVKTTLVMIPNKTNLYRGPDDKEGNSHIQCRSQYSL